MIHVPAKYIYVAAGLASIGVTLLIAKVAQAAAPSGPPATVGPAITVWPTYYDFPDENDFAGAQDTALTDTQGNVLAMVPAAFASHLCLEGAGKLRDGRVINYAGPYAGGYDCHWGGPMGFRFLDSSRYPWGSGCQGKSLVPLRTWAADLSVFPCGTKLYSPRWDGVAIPRIGDIGGFVHDGRFTVEDSGGAINGNHIDFYAGSQAMTTVLDRILPTRTNFDVYRVA